MKLPRSRLLLFEAEDILRRLEREAAHGDAASRERYTDALRRHGRHDDANRYELKPHINKLHDLHNRISNRPIVWRAKDSNRRALNQAHRDIWHTARRMLKRSDAEYKKASDAFISGSKSDYEGPSPMALTTRAIARSLNPKLSSARNFISLLGHLHGSNRPLKRSKGLQQLTFYKHKVPRRAGARAGHQEFKDALDYHKIGRVVAHTTNESEIDHRGVMHTPWLHYLTVHDDHGEHAKPRARSSND